MKEKKRRKDIILHVIGRSFSLGVALFLINFKFGCGFLLLSIVLGELLLGTTNSIFFNISFVLVAVQEVDQNRADNSCTSNTSVHPSEFGFHSDRYKSELENGCNAVGEQEKRHDNRLHGLGSLLVSILVTSGRCKDFGQGNKAV